ncbi:MAG: hypothetical protein KA713_09755 [Chryseotalea sp. WA131a]|nr:MAG: hypothetical protein KA713_09755 [Chryseotalea sp. WA131a]
MRLGLLVIFALLFACVQTKQNDSSATNCLPDSLFAAINLRESISLNDISRENSGRRFYYKSKQLKEMDSLQIVKLLFPFLGDYYKPSYWIAGLVSKQEKIGDLQPIIVRVEGFEYMTLWYLLLDDNCNLKDEFNIEECGYDASWGENPIGMYCKKVRRSKFDKGVIDTYEIKEIDFKDNLITIDSLTYHTIINSDNKFVTKRKDSIRITRPWTE